VYRGAALLILDEPTAAHSQEVKDLFGTMKRMS
jgi:ABC-type uncharacterized transport system ATPase subunit